MCWAPAGRRAKEAAGPNTSGCKNPTDCVAAAPCAPEPTGPALGQLTRTPGRWHLTSYQDDSSTVVDGARSGTWHPICNVTRAMRTSHGERDQRSGAARGERPRRRGWDRRRDLGRRMIRDRRRATAEVPFERRAGSDRRSGGQRRASVERRTTPPEGLHLLDG